MDTGEPEHFLYVIQTDPNDTNSLIVAPFESSELGTFLFTATKHADAFLNQLADPPKHSVIAPVLFSDLPKVLESQIERGVKHVTTDPIPNSTTYLEKKTLTIEAYIAQTA